MHYLLKSLTLLGALAVGGLALPGRAQAHDGWHGGGWGWGIGIDVAPIVVPGPYVYPPYYAPPPVYVAPAPAPVPDGYYEPYPGYIAQAPVAPVAPAAPVAPSGAAQSCHAGAYICPMEVSVPVGRRCYCPGNDGARQYGTAQ